MAGLVTTALFSFPASSLVCNPCLSAAAWLPVGQRPADAIRKLYSPLRPIISPNNRIFTHSLYNNLLFYYKCVFSDC